MKSPNTSSIKILAALAAIGSASFNSCKAQEPSDPSTTPFPDYNPDYMISPDKIAERGIKPFKLSQNYPQTQPTDKTSPLPPFAQADFQSNPKAWLIQVRDYCFAGNIGAADVENDFRVADQPNPKWFHMPWQHYGPFGREGYHGLTMEAPVIVGQLAAGQKTPSVAFAVGFYNDRAAWKIGQVWKDHANPDLAAMGEGFPEGSVFFKLLFTAYPERAAVNDVPFFTNGVWWQAFATATFPTKDPAKQNRKTLRVVLTQMDIMVRHPKAKYGWVLGNFQFNGNASGKHYDKTWKKLVPVGLMWGQDEGNNVHTDPIVPMTADSKTPINTKIIETWINPDGELPTTHLGWNGRLNGPLDKPLSSCYSCHSTAQWPVAVKPNPIFDKNLTSHVPKDGDPVGDSVWMQWFRSIQCNTLFTITPPPAPTDPAPVSTDFCLQLSGALANFHQAKADKSAGKPSTPSNSAKTVRALR